MILHQREEWLRYARHQTFGGPAFEPAAAKMIAYHYPGGYVDVDGPNDVLEPEDTAIVLARMHDDYMTNPKRGYALGYGWCVDPLGHCWVIRGTDFRMASNGAADTNKLAPSILILVRDVNADATPAQADSLRWLTGWIRRRVPTATGRCRHKDLYNTPCCGEVLGPRVLRGDFEPLPEITWPPTPTPTPTREDMMLGIITLADAGAVFEAVLIPHTRPDGAAILSPGCIPVRWIGQGRLDELREVGARELQLTVGDMKRVVLGGAIPEGDHRHHWVADDFASVL